MRACAGCHATHSAQYDSMAAWPSSCCSAVLSPLPSRLLQEERDRLQQAVGELETSVEQLQQREAAGEGELRQQLGAATAENAQLKEQLAAAGQATEALQEQLAEVCGERQRLEGKVQKHKQVRQWV